MGIKVSDKPPSRFAEAIAKADAAEVLANKAVKIALESWKEPVLQQMAQLINQHGAAIEKGTLPASAPLVIQIPLDAISTIGGDHGVPMEFFKQRGATNANELASRYAKEETFSAAVQEIQQELVDVGLRVTSACAVTNVRVVRNNTYVNVNHLTATVALK